MGLGKTYQTKYILDSKGNTGAVGDVLSTTSTGVDWVPGSSVGSNVYLPLAGGTLTGNLNGTSGVFTGDLTIGQYIKHNGDADTYFGFSASNQVLFHVGGGDRLIIKSNGDIGIKTNIPVGDLQVGGLDDGSNYEIVLGWNAVSSESVGTRRSAIRLQTGSTAVNNSDVYRWDMAILAAPATASNEPFGSDLAFLRTTRDTSVSNLDVTMILTQLGNVGIGVSAPTSKLHVGGSISGTSYSGPGQGLDNILPLSVYATTPQATGVLIRTNISTSDYAMIFGTIKLEQFNAASKQTIEFSATALNTGVLNNSGATCDIAITFKMFNYDSKWYLWIPMSTTYTVASANIYLGNAYQGQPKGFNEISTIVKAAVPSSGVSNSVDITPVVNVTTANAATSHNHDSRYYTKSAIDANHYGKVATDAKFTSTDGSGDEWKFTLGDESNMTGNKWYKVALVNQGSGGLHIKGSLSNHVESFGTQKIDLLIQAREGGANEPIEITGTVDVLNNATGTSTDKVGIRVIESDNTTSAHYHYYAVYIRTTRYTQAKFHLTKFGGGTAFYTSKPSVTSEPAPATGGNVEIDTSTYVEGVYTIVDSEPHLTVKDGSALFSGNITAGSTSLASSNNYVLDVKKAYQSGYGHVAYFGAGTNTAAKLNYDTVVVAQDDVTCLAIIEGNAANTHASEQALRLAVGDGSAVISSTSTASNGMYFYTNRATNTLGYQINAGTRALHLANNGNATFAGDVNLGTGKNLYLSGTSGLRFVHDGTNANIINATGDLKISSNDTDKDIIFRGKDGVSTITALTLDMSDGGWATFNSGITVASTFSPSVFNGSVSILGDLNITGDINSTSVTNLDVDDLTITVAKGAADSAAADGAGIVVDGASASLLYTHSGTKWNLNKDLVITGNLEVTGSNIELGGNWTIQGTDGTYFQRIKTIDSSSTNAVDTFSFDVKNGSSAAWKSLLVLDQHDAARFSGSATFAGALDIRGSGYNQIKIAHNRTADTNKQSGIVTENYEGNNVSIIQTFQQNNSNAVYYGSADGSYAGVQKHYFMVNADSDTAGSGHEKAFEILSDKNSNFFGNVSMPTGNSTGKFAVMSTGVHSSYDFYNEGTSYFNNGVTVDASFHQTGGGISSFSDELQIADVVDGPFTALRLMNQKSYGSGTGTNEKVRFAMGISESGIAYSGREGFVIELGVGSETDSSNGVIDFKVRDGGSIGTYQTVNGEDKSVEFIGATTLKHGSTTHKTTFAYGNEINTFTAAGAAATMYLNWRSGGTNIGNNALVVAKAGNTTIKGNFMPHTNGAYNIGSSSMRFGSLFVNGISASTITPTNIELQGNIKLLNKAQTAYINFAARNVSGSETVIDLTNVGSIHTSLGYLHTSTVGLTSGSTGYKRVGTWSAPQGGETLQLQIIGGSGYNANSDQQGEIFIFLRTSNGTSTHAATNGSAVKFDGYYYKTGNSSITNNAVRVEVSGTNEYTIYINALAHLGQSIIKADTVEGCTFITHADSGGSSTNFSSSNYLDILPKLKFREFLEVHNSNASVGTQTPKTDWYTTAYNGLQVAGGLTLWGRPADAHMSGNYYVNTGGSGGAAQDTYINNGYAHDLWFDNNSGSFRYRQADSGTAGNAITWATPFTITNAGEARFSRKVKTSGNTDYYLDLNGSETGIYMKGGLFINSTHSHGNIYLKYTHSDVDNSGALTAWVSEPGMTYHTSGIGGNIHKSGPHYGRAINHGYGTYMRFHKDTGNITMANTTATSGNSGGQGNVKFTFAQNGTLTCASDVIAYSDARLKTEVKKLDGNKVYQMRGVSFVKDDKKGSGVIAQEMQKVAPELVKDDGEYLGVAYGNLTGYLIEAIKDLKAEVEELKAQKASCTCSCNCNCNCKN